VKEEMSDQTRMIIFVALLIAVLMIWSHFFQPPPPKPGQNTSTPSGQTTVSNTASSGAAPSEPAPSPSTSAPAHPVSVPVVTASAEKTIVVESPVYRVEFSNKGAIVRSWQLKKYLDEETPPRPLDLVNTQSAEHLGWPFSIMLSDTLLEAQANSALYEVAASSDHLNAPAEITFHWSNGHLEVTKKLDFTPGYQMTVDASVALDGQPIPVAIAWRGGFGDKAVYKAAQLVNVFYKSGDKLNLLTYKKLGVSGNQSQPLLQGGPMEFAGIEDQFFTATFIPNGSDLSLWDWMQNYAANGGDEPTAEMAAGVAAPGALRARVYVGPKDLGLLSKVHPSLEELINFGWTGIIAKPMLFALQWLHKYIPNYGWAIVVFTLLISMVLFPIRLWTFHSTRKMQMVAPEIKAIQDRYKKYSMSDPRKRQMNEEVMAVYQREGVNPAGSCLPMLVQIPFLWAFYRMLAGAIELRHAPWIWWIHDLSAKDPFYIVPILMVITTYLMTKMTPTPAAVDPSQQKMMLLMPLFMGFIFFNLSSGLNLYYFTSNLVGVAQQWYLNRTQPLPSRSKFKKKSKE
jgi:YidC/Oxa1 family membrane protein insertase